MPHREPHLLPARRDARRRRGAADDRKRNPSRGSYTNRLLEEGIAKIAKKVGEEGVEAALAALGEDDDALAGEAADLLYHLVVLLTARGLSAADVEQKLRDRRGTRRPS